MKLLSKTVTAILLIFLAVLSFHLRASVDLSQKSEIKILVLLSNNDQLPWVDSFKLGLKDAHIKHGKKVQFYSENMEAVRLNRSLSGPEWSAHLAKKYQAIQFNAAISEGQKGSEFLQKYGRQFLGNAPFVYHTPNQIEDSLHSKTLKVQFSTAIEKTFEIATRQNSNAERIVIIEGENIMNRAIINTLLPLIEQKTELKVTTLKGLSTEQLKDKLSKLQKNSIVFYFLRFKDKAGKPVVPEEELAVIAATSQAPIYSFSSSLLGTGVVGGHVHDAKTSAQQMVNAIMDYLENGTFKANYPTLKTTFDWQQIKKYGIAPDTIPAHSIVINKPLPLFDQYLLEMLLFIITMVVLIFSITLYWARKLSKFNHQLNKANQNACLAQKQAELLSRTDHLSGMNNRRAFFDISQQVLIEAKRSCKAFSLLMLDIDFFKEVNDNYGHAIGDEIIKSVAKTIELQKREMDISARFGGEEFIILSPTTNTYEARILAERIRMKIGSHIYNSSGNSFNVTVSIGIFSTESHSGIYSLEDYIKCADEALYQAKERGRNRIDSYDEIDSISKKQLACQ